MSGYPKYRLRPQEKLRHAAALDAYRECGVLGDAELLELREVCREICLAAAARLMEFYQSAGVLSAERKEDGTPVTAADMAADCLLIEELSKRTPYPVITEETQPSAAARRSMPVCWMIDPLDGTQNFINRDGEFCIAAALLAEGHPLLGVIVVPAQGAVYQAVRGLGAEVLTGGGSAPLRHPKPARPWRVVDSKLPTAAGRRRAQEFCRDNALPGVNISRVGSAYKLGLLAGGEYDLSLRFDPMSEWDIAAGDCILREAGCYLVDISSNELVAYNQRPTLKLQGYLAARADLEFNIEQ